MTYVSVIDNKLVNIDTAKPKKAKASGKVGCENCPQNERPFIHKLKAFKEITGRRLMLWGEAPTYTENDTRKTFTNQGSVWLMDQLRRLGIKRIDCDFQYAVRCWPTDSLGGSKLKARAPNREEIKCCRTYNTRALELNKGKARVHAIFGPIAAKSLLGTEYKKGTPIFWSDKLHAHVVVLDNPSTLLRNAPKHKLITFQQRLEAAAKFLELPGKYSYIEAQDYKLVTTVDRTKQVLRIARKKSALGNRISVDIETGWVDEHGRVSKVPGTGKEVVLCIGIAWAPGQARTIVIDHPEHKWKRKERRRVVALLRAFMEDPRIFKVMHHGSSDARGLRDQLGIKVRGYRFDTNYSTYLKWPHQKAYGFDALSQSRFIEFCGYKDIVKPYFELNVKGKIASANFAKIPLKIMRLYNGADCDITKRAELATSKVNLPLLTAYTDAAFTLDAMERRGPWFDNKYYDTVVHLIPLRLKIVRRKLLKLSGSKKTKLGSTPVIAALLYDKFGFEPPLDKKGIPRRTSNKETLKLFALGKGKRALFCELLIEFRALSKMESTYIDNYRRSAEVNGGQLRTRWWLTGAASGRMSSGGGKSKESDRVNFQNLHGDPVLQNLLVSDKHWRRVLKTEWLEDWDRIEEMPAFLALDYGQVEIRMLAQFSGDPVLMAAIESGDIHSAVGHELTGIAVEQIKHDKNIRTMIKQVHFGIIYGLTVKGLFMKLRSEGVKVTKSYCQELYDKYFRRFRKVKQWIDATRYSAERNGYVETLFGFRRPIFTEGEEGRGSFWGNQAVNSPIQGSAHQLLLFALAKIRGVSKRYQYLQNCVMEVHDALVFFNRVKELPEAFSQAQDLMQRGVPEYVKQHFGWDLAVPLVAEGKAGFRFGTMTDYNGESPKKFVRKWREANTWSDRQIELIWKEGKTKDEAKKIVAAERYPQAA
jgi:uracil-DNA glycosylase family 4